MHFCNILFVYLISVLSLQIKTQPPKLLLISFDGFRPQYLKDHHLPTFRRLANEGVLATTISAFSTVTFPNHFSMVTGLTQEHHGIVNNYMYDKWLNASFDMSCCNEDNRWWLQNVNTVPIWHANQMESNSRGSGAIGFVGSLISLCGMPVRRTVPYSGSRTYKEIVDLAISWFSDQSQPVNMLSIYFNEPDKSGHAFGPDSKEVAEALQECDRILKYLRDEMIRIGYWDNTNVIVTTDHGMAKTDPKISILLSDYIDLSRCVISNAFTVANIYTDDVQTALEVERNLSNIPNYNVYQRNNVPAEYFYSKNIRIGDVVVIPDVGYVVFNNAEQRNASTLYGSHGYNNSHPEMKGIMIARGPGVAQQPNHINREIRLIDVYPLMIDLLKLPRRNVDGSYEAIQEFLVK